MLSDPYLVGAVVVLVLAIGFAAWPRSGGSLAPTGKRPGRQLIDYHEEAGKEAAGRIIETALGQAKAEEVARSMATSLAGVATIAAPTGQGPATSPVAAPK